MGKWVSIIFQIYLWQKSLHKTNEMIEFAERTMVKAKGYMISALGLFVAVFFFMAGLVTAIIEVGLQMEKEGHLSFNGLMISAVIFFGLALFFGLMGIFPLLLQKKMEPAKPEPQPFQLEKFYPLIEELLKQALQKITEPKEEEVAKKKNAKNPSEESDVG